MNTLFDLQNKYTIGANYPRTPRPRASLPRFIDEMPHRDIQRNQFENSSSSDSDESSTEDESLSYSVSKSASSSPETRNANNLSNNLKKQELVIKENGKVSQKATNKNTHNTSAKGSANNKISQTKVESGHSYILITCLVIATCATIIPIVYNSSTAEDNLNKDKVLNHVKEEILSLKREFRNQENKIWAEIYSGIIEVIRNPTRPSIFVLFADQNDLMNCLALTIGELGRMAFGTDASLKVKPAQLEHDTGEVIEKLRSVIPQRKSVIFWDFLSINDKALNAFHFICDRENPLIQQAIYVITVKAEGYTDSANPLEFIENKLKSNLTGRIKEDSLMPLITRITDGPIISVKPEINMQCRFKNTINY